MITSRENYKKTYAHHRTEGMTQMSLLPTRRAFYADVHSGQPGKSWRMLLLCPGLCWCGGCAIFIPQLLGQEQWDANQSC